MSARVLVSLMQRRKWSFLSTQFINRLYGMKWLFALCNMSVFKLSLNQTEGNGVFRAWAHITLNDTYSVMDT